MRQGVLLFVVVGLCAGFGFRTPPGPAKTGGVQEFAKDPARLARAKLLFEVDGLRLWQKFRKEPGDIGGHVGCGQFEWHRGKTLVMTYPTTIRSIIGSRIKLDETRIIFLNQAEEEAESALLSTGMRTLIYPGSFAACYGDEDSARSSSGIELLQVKFRAGRVSQIHLQ